MARPKKFHGGNVAVRLPKDVDIRLRAAALESGKTLSDLIRETLAPVWGKVEKPREMHPGQ
jgi:predicted HicB family RNase H-like nuclease